MDAKYLNKVEEKYIKNKKDFRAGDKVKIHLNITEAGKERIQVFEGVVIAIQGKGIAKSIVVRKISHGVGVEKIIPLNSPTIKKIEIIEKGKARRAKLYYMRERVGKRSLDVIIDESYEGEDPEEEIKESTDEVKEDTEKEPSAPKASTSQDKTVEEKPKKEEKKEEKPEKKEENKPEAKKDEKKE